MRIRTLIAVSDACSHQILRAAVGADPELHLVAECNTSSQAIQALSDHCPSLVFLDVQLRDLDCVELVKALGAETLVATIFVVPPGDYAMQAFHGQAFGYVVKPITNHGLLKALREAKTYVKSLCPLGGEPNPAFRPLRVNPSLANRDRILIKAKGRLIFLRAEEIDWIQANGNYVRIHVGEASYLHRETVIGLERHLDPARFLRIHRSAIVNIDKIRELRPWPTGEYIVLMRSGKELTLSRGYRARLPLVGEATSVDSVKEEKMVPPINEFSSKVRIAHPEALSNRETSNGEFAN
jgi:two-component system LytT family response regulator